MSIEKECYSSCDSESEESENENENENENIPSESGEDLQFVWQWKDNFTQKLPEIDSFPEKDEQNIEVTEPIPINVFRNFFCDKVINMIVEQTNLYGKQKFHRRHDGENWIDITRNEIEAFIGMNVIMGFHKLPSYRHYWNNDENLYTPVIANVMSIHQFDKILSNIHLEDNSKFKNTEDKSKLYKVEKFLDLLKENYKKNYKVSPYTSIDESMIKFTGRSSIKQYLPLKPIRRGYKVWVAADSTNGYVYEFDIYCGKDSERSKNELLGEHVVKKLLRQNSNGNIHVYFDNYFTSLNLLRYLQRKGVRATGTVRSTRKNMPKSLVDNTEKLQRGEFRYKTCEGISVVKWMDTKIVYVASNFYNPQETMQIWRKNKDGTKIETKCPKMIAEYNKFMGGVDRADQNVSIYIVDRKSVRNWIRIFIHFLYVSLHNAFICYKSLPDTQDITFLQFLSSIATSLIAKNSFRKRVGRPLSNSLPCKTQRTENIGVHMPIVTSRRRCVVCTKSGRQNRSTIACTTCNVSLCITSKRNCFQVFHCK